VKRLLDRRAQRPILAPTLETLAAAGVGTWAAYELGWLSQLNALANAVALVQVVHIMWWYHRNTAWQLSDVGRTTMAIKGVLLMLALTGVIRRVAEQLALLHQDVTVLIRVQHAPGLLADIELFGSMFVTATWVVFCVVLTKRLAVIRRLQADALTQPEPPTP